MKFTDSSIWLAVVLLLVLCWCCFVWLQSTCRWVLAFLSYLPCSPCPCSFRPLVALLPTACYHFPHPCDATAGAHPWLRHSFQPFKAPRSPIRTGQTSSILAPESRSVSSQSPCSLLSQHACELRVLASQLVTLRPLPIRHWCN